MTDALPQPGPKGIESFAARVLLVILLGALTLAAWRLINIAILGLAPFSLRSACARSQLF